MNNYKKAIDIIIKAQTEDLISTVYNVAKNNPAVFIKNYELIKNEDKQSGLDGDLLKIIKTGQLSGRPFPLIEAIKHCRNVTGMGLRESKDYCDELIKKNGISK